MNSDEIKHKLTHALTRHDRRNMARKRGHYNYYALGQYLMRLDEILIDIDAGASPRAAILAAFSGSLANDCLRAIGETKATQNEIDAGNGRWSYRPVAAVQP